MYTENKATLSQFGIGKQVQKLTILNHKRMNYSKIETRTLFKTSFLQN